MSVTHRRRAILTRGYRGDPWDIPAGARVEAWNFRRTISGPEVSPTAAACCRIRYARFGGGSYETLVNIAQTGLTLVQENPDAAHPERTPAGGAAAG